MGSPVALKCRCRRIKQQQYRQVSAIESESEVTREVNLEVLADHSTDDQCQLIGKVGNDYLKDPV